MDPTLPGYQGPKMCIKFLTYFPYKPILYPSNDYDDYNVIWIKWSGYQVEDYTTQNILERQ